MLLIGVCAVLSLGACMSLPDAASTEGTQTPNGVAELACRDSQQGKASPTVQQLTEMRVQAATVCRWTNAASGDPMKDRKFRLTDDVGLSGTQAAELMNAFAGARKQKPKCWLIDSPPSVTYSVLARDEQGNEFRVTVPQDDCLGFRLAGGTPYSSWELTNLLGTFVQAADH